MLKMRERERNLRPNWLRNRKEERQKLHSKKEKQIKRLKSKRRNQKN
jgi:hypothetical protein